MNIYDHVEKYWEVIDRASLNAFLMVTEKGYNEDLQLLEDIKELPTSDSIELLADIDKRFTLREKVQQRLKEAANDSN